MTTNTDSAGNYLFPQLLCSGNFCLTPSASSGYAFSPATQSVKRLSANQTMNFTAPSKPKPPPCLDDTWKATSTINAAEGRRSHTATWTGSEMIVWGGQG